MGTLARVSILIFVSMSAPQADNLVNHKRNERLQLHFDFKSTLECLTPMVS